MYLPSFIYLNPAISLNLSNHHLPFLARPHPPVMHAGNYVSLLHSSCHAEFYIYVCYSLNNISLLYQVVSTVRAGTVPDFGYHCTHSV